jgi:hypothetical protein
MIKRGRDNVMIKRGRDNVMVKRGRDNVMIKRGRDYNGQKKEDKKTSIGPQSTIQKTKD